MLHMVKVLLNLDVYGNPERKNNFYYKRKQNNFYYNIKTGMHRN